MPRPTTARKPAAATPRAEPLTPDEEAMWRALAQVLTVLPRRLEADLVEASGLTLSEYKVLVDLSEAPGRSLRMHQLVTSNLLTNSGMTRVVDRLERDGFIERTRSADDGRGHVAVLTRAGLRRLQGAYPSHLASVRANVVDHLGTMNLRALARALEAIAADCASQANHANQASQANRRGAI